MYLSHFFPQSMHCVNALFAVLWYISFCKKLNNMLWSKTAFFSLSFIGCALQCYNLTCMQLGWWSITFFVVCTATINPEVQSHYVFWYQRTWNPCFWTVMGHSYPTKYKSLQTDGKLLFHVGAGVGIKNKNTTGHQWLHSKG